jgi:AI-2 transport protein TqsA
MSDSTGAPATRAAGRSAVGLPRPVVVLVGLASAAIVLGAVRTGQGILAPAILALVIAIAVSPAQAWLARRLPGWLALLVSVVATFVLLFVFIGVIGWSLWQFGTQVGSYQDQFDTLTTDVAARAAELGVDESQVQSVLGLVDFGSIAGIALDVAQGLYGALTTLSFAVALLFFLLVDGGSFGRRFAAVRRINPAMAGTLADLGQSVRRYLVVTTVFGLIVAAFDVVFLLVVGVPLAFVWGVLAFLTGYIPTIGLIIGMVPPVVIALLEDGWPTALVVLVGYLVINNGIQNVIQPKFVGEAVGFNIAISFVSLVVWAFLLGPLGALLAIPMSLMFRAVLVGPEPRANWLTILLNDRPPPEEEVRALAAANEADTARDAVAPVVPAPPVPPAQPAAPTPPGQPGPAPTPAV